ncbi:MULTISPECIES: hypothetical protein [unclassified Bradyrhizobium]|uniref:hypothetical protein n=1 Tax=unclassified Bradyrhizobium TaxID=2631580 RepID=UPI002916A40A|nr:MULTISPECIES: hypothetical protein [unclassified Bradyrhizobium]
MATEGFAGARIHNIARGLRGTITRIFAGAAISSRAPVRKDPLMQERTVAALLPLYS